MRVNAERVVLLGWVRAILMQLAHPLVAAGVADHSSFRGGMGAALSRLHHTVGAMLALTFGDDRAHDAALDTIRTIHRRVNGALRAPCGPFPAGTRYSAEDPALLLWVHATLIDSILRVYEQLVATLSEIDRDDYCAEAADVAVALGAHPQDVPRTWRALQAYLHAQLASGTIEPCTQARELAGTLLAAPLLPLLATGLLTDQLRRGYGFRWNRRRERSFVAVMATLRMARRITPRWLAWWPDARAARRLE